ncbi:MAG: GNAT family N-acetyltransferase [Flavobacteriaceae bacterium]|nr:GNAT family N-acetyltransferase [Flavobacteriaceae bacterium]
MSTNHIELRKILAKDNNELAEIIREVLVEQGAPKVGTAYEDPHLYKMHENYEKEKGFYYVALVDGKLVGGCGIGSLSKGNEEICELQKMYILKKYRGLKIGRNLLIKCLEEVEEYDYKQCYLETMSYMIPAQKLYKSMGFESIEAPMGDTCHYSCNVWMLKQL